MTTRCVPETALERQVFRYVPPRHVTVVCLQSCDLVVILPGRKIESLLYLLMRRCRCQHRPLGVRVQGKGQCTAVISVARPEAKDAFYMNLNGVCARRIIIIPPEQSLVNRICPFSTTLH